MSNKKIEKSTTANAFSIITKIGVVGIVAWLAWIIWISNKYPNEG
jgi:hypothetical protein